MRIILTLLHTLISYLLIAFFGILFFIPSLIFLLIPARWRYESSLWYVFLYCAYRIILFCTLLPIKFIGKRNIPKEPAIIVANHQSSLDIPLVGSLLNTFPHVWLAKKELFSEPLYGWIISRISVPIDVETPQKAMRSLVRALTLVRDKKMHAIIFPEGGRYIDGKIHDFFSGFVILAKKTGRPVVPVCIFNACTAYPPGAFLARWCPIKVVVGKPMHLEENESDEAFKDRVHAWFIEQVKG